MSGNPNKLSQFWRFHPVKALLPFVMFYISLSTFSQPALDYQPDQNKNAVLISGEWFAGYFATLQYERNLFTTDIKLVRFLNAHLGCGLWHVASAGGSSYSIAVSTLSGSGRHHFEVLIGLAALFDSADYQYRSDSDNKRDYLFFLPKASAGYRFQDPGGRLVFRIGFGLPYIQLGVGYAF